MDGGRDDYQMARRSRSHVEMVVRGICLGCGLGYGLGLQEAKVVC
jgi:hypothetical protein